MDKLYSISKTAEILDVTPKTLRVWEQNLPNKKYLFIAKNIQKQSARNRVTRITLKKKLDNSIFEPKKLKREKVK